MPSAPTLSFTRVLSRALVVLLVAVAVVAARPADASAARDGSAEQQMVQLINQARAATGARPLTLQADISKVAYAWSKHLAQGTELAHNPSFSQQICCWKRVAENVGYVGLGAGNIGGVLVNSMHQLFMNSPGHRTNILNPAFDHVGIGVEISETRLWITVNFREWNGSSLPAVASQPAAQPKGAIARHWTQVVGADLNGDGRDELIFYRASTGAFMVYTTRPDGSFGSRLSSHTISKGWTHIVAADLDGDGDDELIFYRAGTGAWMVYSGTAKGGLGKRLASHTVSKGWSHIVAADLDGDGDDELIFYRAGSGAWMVYSGTAKGWLGKRLASHTVSRGWTRITAADLDGDGDDELIFYRAGSGAWMTYTGTAKGGLGSRLSRYTISTGWTQVVAGDFDGDGDDELAFYQAASGAWRPYSGTAKGGLGKLL